MEQHQREEWYVLERQANERLREGNTPDIFIVQRMFQLLVLPSFAESFSWEICQNRKVSGEYFAMYSVWHRNTDLAKLETPIVRLRHPRPLVPTFEVAQIALEMNWFEKTIAMLENITIPPIVNSDRIGLDGTSYEILVGHRHAQARYSWWEEPPSGWRPLNSWLQETLASLENLRNEGESLDPNA